MRNVDTSCGINRSSNLAMDTILGWAFPVLDHGFIRVIDYMGNDQAIVDAARVSYGKDTKHVSTNEGLINYLMRRYHTSPFEMCELKLHIKLPLFVARQWLRHRMANVNEYSARYSVLENEFYIPEPEQMAVQSTDNKQGRGEVLSPDKAQEVMRMLKHDAARSYDTYEVLIHEDGDYGLARELARMNLPVNIYTQFYWKIDLHNLFHFLQLRNDPHAQYEIRVYADTIQSMLNDWVPLSANAFTKYKVNSINFNEIELRCLANMLDGEVMPDSLDDLSKGEFKEFADKIIKMRSYK